MNHKVPSSSESSSIVSVLWFIRDAPFVEQLVSLAHDTEAHRRSLCDRKQAVADPFCLIQANRPADHAIKNSELGPGASAQNFDGKRFTVQHESQGMPATNTIKRIIRP